MLLFATVLAWLTLAQAPQSAVPIASPDTLRRAAQEAVDAGYQSDVPRLERALAELHGLFRDAALAPRAAYYAGFAQWQLSLIAGQSDAAARRRYLDDAIRDLLVAMSLDATNAETLLLLGHCFGLQRSFDPGGTPIVQWQANALRQRATALAPKNPRVVLIDAMGLYYRPSQAGGNQERGLERWLEAFELFAASKPDPANDAGWGHAEGYLWLAQVYGRTNALDKARAALEKSLAIRPDFVAAQRALAALPRP